MQVPASTGDAPLDARLLSIREAAQYLGVSVDTVFRLMRNGDLTPVRIGRRTLFEPEILRALVLTRRQRPGAPVT